MELSEATERIVKPGPRSGAYGGNVLIERSSFDGRNK